MSVALAGYNLIQNRALPGPLYVPANIAVSVGLVALARRRGCSWGDLGLDAGDAAEGTRLGTLAAGLIAIGAVVAGRGERARRLLRDERVAGQDRGDVAYHTLVRFPLGTALFEEVAFRGVVEGIWRRSGATEREAAFAAAALFGLWHLVPTRDAITGSPLAGNLRTDTARAGAVLTGAMATAVASLGFSWLRRRSGSLLAPWLAHTTVSSAGYIAGVTAWRRQEGGSPDAVEARRLRKWIASGMLW